VGEAPQTGLPRWPLEQAQIDLLDAASGVADAMDRGMGSALPSATAPEVGEAALIGSFHAVRALRCLRAVVTVCRAGYAVESAPIVRSLLEDAVSLRFLSLRPRSRVARWLSFDEQRSLEYWRLSERLGLGLEKSDHIRRIEEGSRTTGSPVWWSNKTPSGMARELRDADPDLSQTFKALYPWLSDVAHANIKTTSSYYFAEADEEPVLRIGPSDHLLHLMLDLGVTLAIRTCGIARELGADIDLDPVLERANAYDEASAESD
jgi:hypothetical protein